MLLRDLLKLWPCFLVGRPPLLQLVMCCSGDFFFYVKLRLWQIQAPFWAHLCVAAVKRWSVHRQSLWIIGLRAINVRPLNHTQSSAVSQRENASSPLKLQPHIYYVYVYKSLRRPHIPEACKERGERERPSTGSWERRCNRGWGLKWRCVKSGQEVESFSAGSVLALFYLQRGAKRIYDCWVFLRTCDRWSEIPCRVNLIQ